jgi:DNA-binding winged helix-turn-helix (wHTH) protein
MATTSNSVKVIRFGVFELDLSAGELRKSGLGIKLQEQPFQVLAALLERPGELVGKEELRKRLWPDDTFVDFDHGLGSAINRLREALGDSAENPRFVETLPRRGYRFIAPVDSAGVAGDRSTGPANAAPPSPPRRGAGGEGVEGDTAPARIGRKHSRWS